MEIKNSDSGTHPQIHLTVANNQLLVGGKTVAEWASIGGSSPLYLYDRTSITRRVNELRAAFPKKIQFHYSVKANPMPALVQHLADLTDGLDVASHQELLVALNTGIDPKDISFAGPGKNHTELESAISAGVVIHVESAYEVEQIALISEKITKRPKIAIRINPDFDIKRSGQIMAGGSKPFGIDSELVPALIKKIIEFQFEITGYHLFCGSQSLSSDNIINIQNQSIDLLIKLCEETGVIPSFINLGGGFGIPYFTGEKPLDLTPIADNLASRLSEIESKLSGTEIILELGRYLVGESGAYIAKIIDKKVSRGKTFLVTNGGLHHHLSATGNLGQVIKRSFPIIAPMNINDLDVEEVSVVGPLCTPLDVLADKVTLPKLEPGDFIAVLQSGAYGRSASPMGFLSHSPPVELFA